MKRRKPTKKETPKIQPLEAKTDNQRDYIRAVAENDVVFCSGPAGCGKSFIAAGLAAQHLHNDNVAQPDLLSVPVKRLVLYRVRSAIRSVHT
jgi:phosphate starvation-inducible protein PhoH